MDVGAAAPDFVSREVASAVVVPTMVARAMWSSTRVVPFSFLVLVLHVCSYYINIKGKAFASFQKDFIRIREKEPLVSLIPALLRLFL